MWCEVGIAHTRICFWSLTPPHQSLALGHLFCLISTAENSVLRELHRYLCVVCRAENDLETARRTLGRRVQVWPPVLLTQRQELLPTSLYHLTSPPSAFLKKTNKQVLLLCVSAPRPMLCLPDLPPAASESTHACRGNRLRESRWPSRQSEPEALFQVPEQFIEKWCGPSPLVTDPSRHPFACVSR